MLQKFLKASVDSTPVDLPLPPTVDQMFADLAKLRPNDPLLQLAPLDCFLADFGDKLTADGISPNTDDIFQKMSKLSSFCDEIRNAGKILEEKRAELKSLTRAATEKREELEGIISWSAAEGSNDSGNDVTEQATSKG